ncbi:ALF repeat-containing protein [Kitasatospora sp. NPDC058184]|uniref:ALF repeat-containing protein n=1 Tax=Kitasatospora sp. NPDC058184 TaxID=3346370 RepID=UPI0036D7ED7F
MKLPRVSAVVAAAVLAPAVLFPTTASATDTPKPTGVSGPDTGSDSAKDTAPQDADGQEQRDRAEVKRILADPKSGVGVREAAEKALKGGAAELRHFLDVEHDEQTRIDNQVRVSQIYAIGGPAVKAAAKAALRGTDEDITAFLTTGQYVARAEDEDRAKVEALVADPKTGPGVREGAEQALKGGAADLRTFLTTKLPRLRSDDNRVKLSQLMDQGGPAVREAANKALDAGTNAAVDAFLNEGFAKAQFEDDRVEVLRVIADKETGPVTAAAAQKAMDGNAEDVRRFLTVELPNLRFSDNRLKVSQIIETGGPAVKKAAMAAYEGSYADLLAFLKDGWAKAQAEDAAAAAKQDNGAGNGTGTGAGTGGTGQQPQTVQPAGLTTGTGTGTTTTGTGTTTGTRTGSGTTGSTGSGALAATGTDGLGWEAGGAAAALAAGAALVVAARRRSTES